MNEQELRQYMNGILNDFIRACEFANVELNIEDIKFEILIAGNTHVPTRLRQGFMAAYIFKNDDICYKVGKTGANSNARFQSQHYNPDSSRSNLARSILNDYNLNSNIEIQNDVGQWIKQNTTRINLFLPENKRICILNLLEAFLQCIFKPIYEG